MSGRGGPRSPRAPALLAVATVLAACGEPQGEQTQSLEGVADTLAGDSAGVEVERVIGLPDSAGADRLGAAADTADPPAVVPVGEDGAPDRWTLDVVQSASTVAVGVPMLSALRTGRHEAFERVVLELSGEGTGVPAFRVSYVDRPLHECGSGREIHPVGDAWLEVWVEPLNAHTEEGEVTVSHQPTDVPGFHNLLRVYMTCDFEAVVTLVIAVQRPEEFRAFSLEQPRRIVVDVRH